MLYYTISRTIWYYLMSYLLQGGIKRGKGNTVSLYKSWNLCYYFFTLTNIDIHSIFYLSIYLPIFIAISIFPSISLSFFLSIFLSIHQSIFPSIYLSIYLSFYLPSYLPIYLSKYKGRLLRNKSKQVDDKIELGLGEGFLCFH